MGFFYWGEPSKPKTPAQPGRKYAKPNYHKAKKRWIDPHTVIWANTPLDEKAVQRYEKDPNRYSDDGDPFVVVDKHGLARGWNGKHRATAAMRQGRKLHARYFDVRDSN